MADKISTLIDINGKKLYAEYLNNFKNRPTIVFLHDSLGAVRLWRDFPELLAQKAKCNILTYDRLGYGRSEPMPTHKRPTNYMELEADILNDLLCTLKIDNAVLFGHSDGGTISLLTASKYPERIKAVVVEAAHIFVEDVTLKGIYEAMDAYKNTDLAQRLAKSHGDKVDTLFRAWTETWTRSDYRDWNIEHFLPAITCPLLFIQGEADEYGTLDQVEKTLSQVKGKADKFIIPGVGHTPHKEKQTLVAEIAGEFIRDL